MPVLIENRPINCQRCGYGPNNGQESSQKDRWGNIIHECRWTCAKCSTLIRVDERVEKVQKPVVKKEPEAQKETKKQ